MRYIAVVNATADDYGVADVRVDYYQFEPTVKLVELYIESESDYQQLTLDQNTLFKLVVAPGVPVPTAYLRQFSNIVHLNTSGVSHAESTAGYVQANAVDLAVDTQTLLDEWLSAANLDDGVVRMAQAIHASLEQKLTPASARIAA